MSSSAPFCLLHFWFNSNDFDDDLVKTGDENIKCISLIGALCTELLLAWLVLQQLTNHGMPREVFLHHHCTPVVAEFSCILSLLYIFKIQFWFPSQSLVRSDSQFQWTVDFPLLNSVQFLCIEIENVLSLLYNLKCQDSILVPVSILGSDPRFQPTVDFPLINSSVQFLWDRKSSGELGRMDLSSMRAKERTKKKVWKIEEWWGNVLYI